MLKPTLVAVAFLASTLPSRAQVEGDPTFNGLVARATCDIRNVTVCRSGSCEQVVHACQGDLCGGTLSLLLKYREYTFAVEKKPLDITKISPAEVGKPLWVKFRVPLKAGLGEGQLTLQPERLGGYTAVATVYIGVTGDPSGRSFTLVNYDCEQLPDGP